MTSINLRIERDVGAADTQFKQVHKGTFPWLCTSLTTRVNDQINVG